MNLKYRIYLLVMVFGLSTNISNSQTPNVIEGEILVHLKTKAKAESLITDFNKTAKSPQLKLKKCVSQYMNIWLLEYDFKTLDGNKLLSKLDVNDHVKTAQFNHKIEYRSTSKEPNDSIFSLQWQYVNRGTGGGTNDADIDVDSAWSITTGGVTATGDTIVVAIVDDGVDHDHPDMIDNLWVNRNEIPNNNIDDDENGYKDDYRGWNVFKGEDDIENDTFWGEGGDHGTPVAGIVGAKGNNSIGVAGISWDIKLMIVAGGGNEADAVSAYSYIMVMRKMYNETDGAKGAFVVATNSSWGINNGQPADAPIWCAMYDSLGKYGVLSAGATANKNTDVDVDGDLPTACPSDYLITVTNTDNRDKKEFYAAYGDTTIDLGAPGSDTYTAALSFTDGPNEAYGEFGGTSGATPHVAGAIGLLYAAPADNIANLAKEYPAATALLIKQFIMDGTDSISDLEGITVTGGRLNVYNSMKLLIAYNDSTTGIDQNPTSKKAAFSITNIFPNPTNGILNIDLYIDKPEPIQIELSNPLGQIVLKKELNSGGGFQKVQLDISDIKKGMYLLTVKNKSGTSLGTKRVFLF